MIYNLLAFSALTSAADEDPIAQLETGLGRRRWQTYDRWSRAEDEDDSDLDDSDTSPEDDDDLDERFGSLGEDEAREVLGEYMAERAVARAVTEELARMAYDDNLARGLSEDEMDERGLLSTAMNWWNNSGIGKKVGNVASKLWNKATSMNWGRRRFEGSGNPVLEEADRLTVKLAKNVYDNRMSRRRRSSRGYGYERSMYDDDADREARGWWDNIVNNVKSLASSAVSAWNSDPTKINLTKTTAREAARAEARGLEDLIGEARSIQARAERLLAEDREERAVFNDDWYN